MKELKNKVCEICTKRKSKNHEIRDDEIEMMNQRIDLRLAISISSFALRDLFRRSDRKDFHQNKTGDESADVRRVSDAAGSRRS